MDFTYKGTATSAYGVILNSLDWYKKPQRRAERLSINGKDGATVVDNAYGALSLRCRITLTATTYMSEVLAWLTGNGVLSFSEDSGKYRNAYILDEIEFRRRGAVWEATFDFFCPDPYRYVTGEAETEHTYRSFANTISNGDYSSGSTGWTGTTANVISTTGNEAVWIATASAGRYATSPSFVSGRKYYIAADIKATSNLVRLDVGGVAIANHTGSGNYERLSGLWTATGTSTFPVGGRDYRTSGWANVSQKYFVCIDLTTPFGAGNEPTKASMDAFMLAYTNTFFSGTVGSLYPNYITNSGTVTSLPIFKIFGTETVGITTGNTMQVALDTESVYIDSDLREVYFGPSAGTITALKNRLATGDFPYLSIGRNNITVTGSVSLVYIVPKTRYL